MAAKPLVIFNQRVRWIAAINIAFFGAFIWVALRFCNGVPRYVLLAVCIAFCLFWIRDLLFGFTLKLSCDGSTIRWQEGKKVGSVALAQVREIRIGVGKASASTDGPVLQETWVRFKLRAGGEEVLPPNLAGGLRSMNWRPLKRMLAYLRNVSFVPIVIEPSMAVEGWEDEPSGAAKGSLPR